MKKEVNQEGYTDTTASRGLERAKAYERSREQVIEKMMPILKGIAEMEGFTIEGRITFKDKRTKRIFR